MNNFRCRVRFGLWLVLGLGFNFKARVWFRFRVSFGVSKSGNEGEEFWLLLGLGFMFGVGLRSRYD